MCSAGIEEPLNGIHEYQTGIMCVNDLTARGKPKTEDKPPRLLAEIQAIMAPRSESESRLHTDLLYGNMAAKIVHEALVRKGWSDPKSGSYPEDEARILAVE